MRRIVLRVRPGCSGLEQFFPPAQPALDVPVGSIGEILQQPLRRRARRVEQSGVGFEVGVAQQRHAALAAAEEFAGAAQAQVLAGDLEAVGVLEDDLQARARRLAERMGVEQDAGRIVGAAANSLAGEPIVI